MRPVSVALLLALLPLPGHGAAAAPYGASYQTIPLARRQSMQQEARVLFGLLENGHYRNKPFIDLDAAALLRGSLTRLDPLRLYLLAADEQFVVRRFARSLKASYLLSGDLYPAFEIFDRFRDRYLARHAWVRTRLEQPFDLARTDTFDPDRRDAPFPTSAAAADALWEQALTAELIEEMLHEPDEAAARANLRQRYAQADQNIATIRPDTIAEQFLNALLALHDPHSGYIAWDTRLDLEAEMTGSVVGIGADLRLAAGRVLVENLIPGGAAETSGQLHPGDQLLSVAETGVPTTPLHGLPLPEVVRRIRGRANTTITLDVEAAASGARRTVTLTRSPVQSGADRASARLYQVPCDAIDPPGAVPVGVVVLPSFYGPTSPEDPQPGSADDVRELLVKLLAAGARAVVLDLRENPGGLTDQAGRIIGHFIDSGPVLVRRGSDSSVVTESDPVPSVVFSGPVVALTAPQSASASELTSGALQGYGRAVVVGGEATFGKGTAQAGLDLARFAAPGTATEHWGELRLTHEYFFLPDGRSTQLRGVPSDIVLPLPQAPHERREDALPGALPWTSQAVDNFGATRAAAVKDTAMVEASLLGVLRERSLARRSAAAEFDWYQRAVELYQTYAGGGTVPLSLVASRTRRDALRASREASQAEKRELARTLAWSSEAVRLDAVLAQLRARHEHLAAPAGANDRPRANRCMAGVYYHAPADGSPWREVRLTRLDPDLLEDLAPPLSAAFAEAAGVALDAAQFIAILNAPAGADEESPATWDVRLAEAVNLAPDDARFADGLSALGARLVALQPHLVGEAPLLDVPLRESLRVAADWVALTASPR